MFVDEPGLQFLFSAMAGYGDEATLGDMETFFSMIDRPLECTYVAIQIRILFLGRIWISYPLMSIPMERCSHYMDRPFGGF